MNIDTKALAPLLLSKLEPFKRYRIIIFVIFVFGLYGYLILQTSSATGVQPSSAQQTAITKRTPHIDAATVKQLEQLQDNSVSVKALFNEARSNPFE
jgi:Flp pilus assembly protein CpaB